MDIVIDTSALIAVIVDEPERGKIIGMVQLRVTLWVTCCEHKDMLNINLTILFEIWIVTLLEQTKNLSMKCPLIHCSRADYDENDSFR